jgi:hypothetical protein
MALQASSGAFEPLPHIAYSDMEPSDWINVGMV